MSDKTEARPVGSPDWGTYYNESQHVEAFKQLESEANFHRGNPPHALGVHKDFVDVLLEGMTLSPVEKERLDRAKKSCRERGGVILSLSWSIVERALLERREAFKKLEAKIAAEAAQAA